MTRFQMVSVEDRCFYNISPTFESEIRVLLVYIPN